MVFTGYIGIDKFANFIDTTQWAKLITKKKTV